MQRRTEIELVTDEPAFVLHSRPYRDHRFIVDFFSLHHGRIGAIYRSPKGKRQALTAVPQPFTPLSVCWRGSSELKNIQSLDRGLPLNLSRQHLIAGMYLNELCMRVLQRQQAVPSLFESYQKTLAALAAQLAIAPQLRRFEWQLLETLGVAPDLRFDADGKAFDVNAYYRFRPSAGMTVCSANTSMAVAGQRLLDLADADFMRSDDSEADESDSMETLRLICGPAIHFLLDGKPLHSRELFRASLKSAPTDSGD